MSVIHLGILVDNLVYHGIPSGKTGYENITFYEQAADNLGISLCFFRLRDIKPGQEQITALMKNDKDQYRKVTVPTPTVIYNRGLYFTKQAREEVESLIADGKVLYNPWNRYYKLDVHEKLARRQKLLPYLPETEKATRDTVWKMLQKHRRVVVKPNSGSLGIGVMKIEKKKKHNVLTYFSQQINSWVKVSFDDIMPAVLQKNLSATAHIVQEYIPLARYKGRVFNLRVACQKNGKGKWQVTGMVGKVAKWKTFVTNMAKGGKAYSADVLLEKFQNKKELLKEIKKFTLNAARVLEKEYPGLADLGFDIGVTKDGQVRFIECNARGMRVSFQEAKMYETWKRTFITPIEYGKFLLEKEG